MSFLGVSIRDRSRSDSGVRQENLWVGPQGELDAVVGEHRVDFIWHYRDQGHEEGRRRGPARLSDDLDESEFACAINGDIEVQLAFGSLHLGDIDMKIADRIGLELLLDRLDAFDIGQAADTMALQAAMQRRACQLRDRQVQGVEAIVERQQRNCGRRQ